MNGNLPQPIKRYMPGLDGLRALSVIAVIFYHFHLKWAQGGIYRSRHLFCAVGLPHHGSASDRMEYEPESVAGELLDPKDKKTAARDGRHAPVRGTMAACD